MRCETRETEGFLKKLPTDCVNVTLRLVTFVNLGYFFIQRVIYFPAFLKGDTVFLIMFSFTL